MREAAETAIRPAREGDEAAVVALWQACGLVTSYNDPVADFRRARAQAGSDVLVCCEEGVVVGSVMVGHDGHRGWIYYLSSHPDRRRQGIGRRLTEAAETWLRDRDIPKLMLMVRDTNRQVVGFYEHIGFTGKPNVVMEKWLCPPSQRQG